MDFTDLNLSVFGGASILARTARRFGLLELLEEAVSVKVRNRGASNTETPWAVIASLGRGHGSLLVLRVTCKGRGLARSSSSPRSGAILKPIIGEIRNFVPFRPDSAKPCLKRNRMEVAVAILLAQLPSVWNMALQNPLERVGFHRPGQSHGLAPPASPGAGLLVSRIVLGVVAVLLVVAHALGGGGNRWRRPSDWVLEF